MIFFNERCDGFIYIHVIKIFSGDIYGYIQAVASIFLPLCKLFYSEFPNIFVKTVDKTCAFKYFYEIARKDKTTFWMLPSYKCLSTKYLSV